MVVIGAICPAYLPPYSTVFWDYKQWRSQGVIEKIRDVLHSGSTPTGKKKIKWTTLIIIDSQAVKNTCNALCQVNHDSVFIRQLMESRDI